MLGMLAGLNAHSSAWSHCAPPSQPPHSYVLLLPLLHPLVDSLLVVYSWGLMYLPGGVMVSNTFTVQMLIMKGFQQIRKVCGKRSQDTLALDSRSQQYQCS